MVSRSVLCCVHGERSVTLELLVHEGLDRISNSSTLEACRIYKVSLKSRQPIFIETAPAVHLFCALEKHWGVFYQSAMWQI